MRWRHFNLLVLLILSAISGNHILVESQNSAEELDEPIDVIIDYAPHTLKFKLNDTENYKLLNATCKGVRGSEILASDEFICENLDACSLYLVTLVIERVTEETPFIFEKLYDNISTEYFAPIVEIGVIEIGNDEIYLNWTSTDRYCISSYQIEVSTTENYYQYNYGNSDNELKLTNLSSCQDHHIQFKTFDIESNIVSNWTHVATTDYKEPGNITGIVIDTAYEEGHAKINWQQPQYSTCIEYYYIKWFSLQCDIQKKGTAKTKELIPTEESNIEDNCTWSVTLLDSHAKEYTIRGLEGCETYGLQFFINSETNAKSEIEQFTSAEKIPGIITLQEPEVHDTKVKLYWNPPEENKKCVKHYEVKIEGPLQSEDQETFDTATVDVYTTFEDLQPCGQYKYTIYPISLNGSEGTALNTEIELLEAKPTSVRQTVIVPEPNSLKISWQEPEFANLCIKEYHLSIWANGKNTGSTISDKTSETNATVKGLYSCQSYTVQIIPTTKSEEDGVHSQTETETAAMVAQTPEKFQSTATYSDGFELSAISQNSDNACETIFARFVCTPNSQDSNAPKKSAERNVEGKVAGTSFRAVLSPLSPYTEYRCLASFYNVAGWSAEKLLIVTTRSYYADMPEEISVKTKTDSSVTFVWQQPRYPNGNINVYNSLFQRIRAEYFVPPQCSPIVIDAIKRESSSREQPFYGLLPFTRYSIQVAAKNEYGLGEYTRPYMVITSPTISDPVTNLKMVPQGPYESDEEYLANVLISWVLPCKSNGQIETFELKLVGERNGETETYSRSIPPDFDSDGVVVFNFTELKPEYSYSVRIAVRIAGVNESSAYESGQFVAPAGIPKRFNETTQAMARVNAYESSNPTSSAVVQFPAYILDSEEGTIMYAAFLLSQKGCNVEPTLVFGALNSTTDWPKSLTWSDVYTGESEYICIQQYQTTEKRWKPETNPQTGQIEYIIGSDKCDDTDDYCNGPLRPDTEFYLVIRLFTKSGFNDAAILYFHTDAAIKLTLIVVSVSGVLFLAFVAGFIYIYITKRMQWKRQSCHDIEDPFGDIMAKNFATYFDEISKPERIAREFKELTMVAMDFSYAASELGCSKNRYTDIYPYDKNRVILDIDAEGSDYINASFIDGYRRKKEYIATQGPKPESTMDFWRMILQHNIRVIVMVTQFREGDTVKCHEYFPYKSQAINVTVKKKETFELYDRSEMTVIHDRYGLKQKVVHFYFKKWPDHGCPVDPLHLINFVRKVKAEKVPSYSSIVVHCSAGVGRTGTFICLDILMQRLKSESKINIYGTVKKLRFQRMKMVQTLEQYTFLYKCAYELVKHKNQRNKNNNYVDNNNSNSKNKKQVTFQEDPESKIQETSNRIIRKQLSMELSAIDEHEQESRPSGSVSCSKRNRPHLRMAHNNSPIILNGQKKGLDFENFDEDSNESVM